MENANNTTASPTNSSGTKIGFIFLWPFSVCIAGIIGYGIGTNKQADANPDPKVLSEKIQEQTPTPSLIPTTQAIATPTTLPNQLCRKSGFAQKWEYLDSYTIKEGDTIKDIVTSQLNDDSRINEVMQLNGGSQLVVGSALYLPPSTITKSSGNIKEVYGRLVKKDTVSWQVSFNGDASGQGIIIPAFWFEGIRGKDAYNIGDCVSVLFDDGYKVFSVARQ